MSGDDGSELERLSAELATVKSNIRALKASNASAEEIASAVANMKSIDAKVKELVALEEGPVFERELMDSVLVRRMVVVPSFEIHGGASGLFDFGPVGCALKDNILTIWKKHFVLHDRMFQVECTNLTTEPVLRASGHVERFTDLMVKDVVNGVPHRADKLLEDHIEKLIQENPGMPKEEKEELELIHRQADAYSPEELGDLILNRFKIPAPHTGNELSEPAAFNLMFKTSIGPDGNSIGFLRPETAQGIFVNFKRLLEFNSGKLPFAAAQIGLGFRNEISPQNGLLRVREFTMAEIEHFVHPEDKDHPRFNQIKDVTLTLFSSHNQLNTGKLEKTTAGEAVEKGIIKNQTLAYFLVRTHLFLERIGIDMERVRFRQHLPTEMAHYSSDCWDAEIKLSYGWIECVGHADRSAYDLTVHSKATNNDLRATRYLDAPREVEFAKISADKKVMGKSLKRDAGAVLAYLEELELEAALQVGATLEAGESVDVVLPEKTVQLTPEMVKITKDTRTEHVEKFYPNVIEPSFGIGRILYAVLEHTFSKVEEAAEEGKMARTTFQFVPEIAPYKCGVCPVIKAADQEALTLEIADKLIETDMFSTSDVSGTAIGRKYARFDEIGIPFVITVDSDSITDGSVTLRERDSQKQIRCPDVDTSVSYVQQMCTKKLKWEDLVEKHGLFYAPEA